MDTTNQAGHIVLDLRPNDEYTRHSEGSFIRLSDGRIMYAYSRFTDNVNDDAPSHIAVCFSSDEGESWSEPKLIFDPSDFSSHNIMSVSMLRMQNGDIGMFFGSRQTPSVGHCHLARSNDEGKTWYSCEVCSLTDRDGYYVLNNDRIIRTSTGRLVMPVAFHRGGYDTSRRDEVYFDGRGVVSFRLSDDDGKTWYESTDTIGVPFTNTNSGLQEPGVVVKKNGVLWAYFRTDKMYQYESFSFDGGEHWATPQPSVFTSPNSPMHIVRRPDGALISVWNPIPNYNGRKIYHGFAGRTPIVYAVSTDDGASWSEPVVIEGNPKAGYCYPAVFFTDDNSMLVSYCSGRLEDGDCLAASSIMKISY